VKALFFPISFLASVFLSIPSAAQAPEGSANSRGTKAVLRELVDPFLARVKGQLGPPGAAEAYKEELRVLVGDVDGRAAALAVAAERPVIAQGARAKLIAGLAAQLATGTEPGTDAQARAQRLVTSALERNRELRAAYLHSSLICWCPKENWTLTLTGCARGCANEQKSLVSVWMKAGYTNEEIIDKMVAHPSGGSKVRALPAAEGTHLIGYLFPFALLVLAVILVGLVLRFVTRRGKEPAPASSHLGGAVAADAVVDGTGVTAGDQELGDQIERELKEMEN